LKYSGDTSVHRADQDERPEPISCFSLLDFSASSRLDDLIVTVHVWASMPDIAEHIQAKQKKHHRKYRSLFRSGVMEWIMDVLSRSDLSRNAFKRLNKETIIPLETFCSWWAEL
jgi:hypothetical protein